MTRRREPRGQGLVEFSFALIIFLTVFVGIVDLARGVFTFNGLSDAARQIARETSVHPGNAIGTSPETIAMVDASRGLVQGLTVTSYTCFDLAGDPVAGELQAGRLGASQCRDHLLPGPAAVDGARSHQPHLGQ